MEGGGDYGSRGRPPDVSLAANRQEEQRTAQLEGRWRAAREPSESRYLPTARKNSGARRVFPATSRHAATMAIQKNPNRKIPGFWKICRVRLRLRIRLRLRLRLRWRLRLRGLRSRHTSQAGG